MDSNKSTKNTEESYIYIYIYNLNMIASKPFVLFLLDTAVNNTIIRSALLFIYLLLFLLRESPFPQTIRSAQL